MRTAVVADDEPITRMDIAQMLEELDFKVVGQVADGFDAVESCRIHRPDVVLMDVRMPIFDGIAASKTIVDEDIAGCVVLITAFSDSELIEQANSAGVTGYLVKPVEQRLLLPTIEVALSQSRRLRQSRSETDALKRKLSESKLIDRAKAIVASQENISEAEGYRRMQRMAMDKRCTMVSLASAIVEQNSGKGAVTALKERLMEKREISEKEAFRVISERAASDGITAEQAAKLLLSEGNG